MVQKNSLDLINLAPNHDSLWKEDDRRWFAANPKRSFRIRRLFVGELPSEYSDGQTHVLIRQLAPGLRDKRFLLDARNGIDFDNFPDRDFVALALWERLDRGGASLPLSEVIDQAKAMESAAGDGGLQ